VALPFSSATGTGLFFFLRSITGAEGGRKIAVADFNGDGKLDLIATKLAEQNAFDVLLGNGNGTLRVCPDHH
jgi:hypothetical protein